MDNLGEIKSELNSRGFTDVNDARKTSAINDAYHFICELEPWPFLRGTIPSEAPVDATEIRQVLSVTDTTNGRTLRPRDIRKLQEMDLDLDTTGIPVYWYLDGTDLKTYPVASSVLNVIYVFIPGNLETDADVPSVPSRYRSLIADEAELNLGASRFSPEEMAAKQARLDRKVGVMRANVLSPELDDYDRVETTWCGSGDW